MADIKMEDPEQVRIKPDPEDVKDSPMLFADDPEDAGDVEFYDQNLPGNPLDRAYLARMPNYIWQAWQQVAGLDEDAEIELGRIRHWEVPNGKGGSDVKMQLKLRSDLVQHQNLPKEYNLDITDMDVRNTYIFSERDLPGYAAKNKQKADALAQNIPAHLLRQKQQQQQTKQEGGGGSSSSFDRKGRTPIARKSIPKKTAIAGRIRHEILCTPLNNIETDYVMTQRALEATRPKNEVKIVNPSALGRRRFEHLAGQDADERFGNLIKPVGKPAAKVKKSEDKYTRMDKDKLLDALAECFGEHKYWPLKAFKERLRQPEAWLREVLEEIAVIVRTGTFANTWQIKKEYEGSVKKNPASDSVAAVGDQAPAEAEEESSDDEEDLKMEDV